jgi:tripartite-type tricarboxylate transporter receptor subunit TctC
MPSLPTAAAQGLSGVDAYTWNAIFLPKGTPPAIVARLNAAVSRAMDSPAARARLDKLGLDIPLPARRTPDYLGQYVAAEIAKWGPPIKASGVAEE